MEADIDLLTKRHNLLLNFSKYANILAWVALSLDTIVSIMYAIQLTTLPAQIGGGFSLWELARFDPWMIANKVMGIIQFFLTGVIAFLVLKGTSLCLAMVVETDVNHRIQSQEASHE